MTTLQRLVRHPHTAVFDDAPHEQLLFRLRHPNGASWSIAEAVMTARAGAVSVDHDLSTITVAQLITSLAGAGFMASEINPEFAALSALVLVEGDGDEGRSNGDRVFGYTSLMWVLMGGYAGVVREAGLQVVQALRQMLITQAEGEWLDLWGKLYDVGRRQAELDAVYQSRIPKEAFRLRQSPIAIEEAVKDATGKAIRIEEPWSNIFRLDGSLLSGPDKFADGDQVGYFLIQPTSSMPIDWTDVLPVIHRNRAAGVLVLPPFSRNQSGIDADIDGTIVSAITSIHSRFELYQDRALLDYGAIEDVSIPNHPAIYRRSKRHLSESSPSGWLDLWWLNIPWNDENYQVESRHSRSYRLYRYEVTYLGQYWQEMPWQHVTWADFTVLINSSHKRS